MITVRAIEEQDLEMIMNWRMDKDITRYMNTDPVLTLEGQKEWLAAQKAKDDVQYWMIEVDSIPAGVINLAEIDWKNGSCSWGYYIGEKKLRSLKLALSLEMSLYDYIFDTLGLTELHGGIFSLNTGVIKMHEACGSSIVREVKGEVIKNGIAYDMTYMRITADTWHKIRQKKKYEKISFEKQE